MPSDRPAPPDVPGEHEAAAAPASEPPGAPSSSHPPPPNGEDRASDLPPPPGESGQEGRRRRFESRLPSLIRRGIEKGIEAGLYTFERSIETGRETTDAVRGVFNEVKIPDIANAVGRALQEAKLPREIAGAVLTQLDDAKNDVVRIIAREVRDFLEATDIASEIKAALTSLSFEVRTEVRFIPNEAGTGVRPDVRSRGRVKRTREKTRTKRPPQEQEPDDDLDED